MEANTKRQPESKKWFFLKILCAAFFCFIAAANVVPASAGIWYVDGGVVDSGNGGSWVTAFKTIQAAIDAAESNDEIWVKEGTYALTSRIDLNKGVLLYGGFAGIETEKRERDWRTNETIIDGQDLVYHCFRIDTFGLYYDATIDGFAIKGGNANGVVQDDYGHYRDSYPDYNGRGGAIVNLQSATTIANCTFVDNKASAYASGGGAIYISGVDAPTIINCAFFNNESTGTGTHGGAIYSASSNPTIAGCVFQGNIAGGVGGALLINGNTPEVINCTFNGNTAQGSQSYGGGGAIFLSVTNAIITNCILWGNSAPQGGPQIFWDGSNNPGVTYCDIEGGYAGTGNIPDDPQFRDAANGDLRIMPGSDCVDAGDDSAVPADIDYDIEGDKRIVGSAVDIGADEYKAVWYVDASMGGNGMSWNQAFQTIQEAITTASPGHEIWVKEGTYYITETIAVAKAVDIYGGFDGTEIAMQQRDWIANKTTVNGQGSAVHCFFVSENITIDGFTIAGGNANGSNLDNKGGGVYISAADSTITNCVVTGNTADWEGGGIYALGAGTIANCLIYGNSAYDGGGIANAAGAAPTVVNCTISKNNVTGNGSGIWNSNAASVVTNCIIWGNTMNASSAPGMYVDGATPTVTTSDVERGTGNLWFDDGSWNLDTNPLFVDPASDDFHLQLSSVCIDAGLTTDVPVGITTDLDGDNRVIDGDEDGTDKVDMGVDEYFHVPATWHVDGTVSSAGDGTTWAQAFKTMEAAVDNPLLRNFDRIWVKAGTYTPPAPEGWGENGAGLTITKAISVYGGFPAGVDDPQWTDRDWKTNETIVDAQADLQTYVNGRTRCFNIESPATIFPDSDVGYPVIDGFTITGGKQWDGGGITMTRRSPTIANCIITGNTTEEDSDVGSGGGIYAFGDLCAPTIVNCLISGNTAQFGGAVWFGRTAGLTDNHPRVVNCTITGNTTTGTATFDAGTIHIIRQYETSIGAEILNAILWDNTVSSGGAEVFSWMDASWTDPVGQTVISNSDIAGASGESWFNNGTGNVDTDPLFADPDGVDDDASTWSDNDYYPGAMDCINNGSNVSVPSDVSDLDGDGNTGEPVPFDLAGELRFSGTVDMGAYEVMDSDGDGVLNIDDNCPFSDNPLQDDGDGDGVGDACDECPSDPGKTDPGQCGCGVADTDTDSDGTADCNDSDDDGDDLPDIWETDYGLDPLDAAGNNGKDGDFDGDGYSNYDEFIAGTEPDEGTSLPLEITEVIPLEGAGIAPDDTRIPNNTSFAVRIAAPAGINIEADTSIVFTVDDGTNPPYARNIGDETVAVTKLDPNEPDTAVTEFWVVYHRFGESGLLGEVYDWENTVEIRVDATDVNAVDMVQQSYAFAIETEAAHDAAESGAPAATTLDGSASEVQAEPDYDAAVAVDSGDLEGCRIFYESGETVQPSLGPSDELPPLDVSGIDAVGVPMNLQPPTVFTTPVKLIIPCPGASDVSALSVYMYNGVDWMEVCDAAGVVQPGGEDWMVDGSRENDNAASPPVIAIRVYHFTGVQAGAAVTGGDDSSSCFVGTVFQSGMAMACALILGVMAAIVITAVRIKKRA